MMKVPFASPVMTKEMIDAAANALRNERLLLGESVFKFEDMFAKMCGTDHAISVNSGTTALQMVLLAKGMRPGDKVATSSLSFIATTNAFVPFGGVPVFSEVIENEYTLDPSKLKLDPKTKAIIPVHLYGHPCRMDEINEAARKAGDILVLEDACQAHGAIYKGKRAGALGHAAAFSFYSTKNMTVGGDGGMITTNDPKLADTMKKYRNCGRNVKDGREEHDVVGYTARLNTVNAAIGIEQLKLLEGWNEKRREAAKKYDELLKGVGDLKLPPQPTKDVTPVFHLYAVRTAKRDELKKFLDSKGVGTGVHYWKPIHLQPIYKQMFGFREGMLPISERCFAEELSLPMFADIKDEQVKYVCDSVKEFFK